MTPYEHSKLMVRDFGGVISNYLELNNVIDSTKSHFPYWMHRAITHNSWFITIAEKIFGPYILNSDDKEIPTRILVIEHIKQDCDNQVPTIKDWLTAIANKEQHKWMNGPRKKDLEWLKTS
jgi:hypothetical protein